MVLEKRLIMKRIFVVTYFLFNTIVGFSQKTTVYCIGDSTMANKANPKENPEHGWAQVLGEFFDERVTIDNRALNGRSSKSFISEGRWDSVVKTLAPGDFVFIQFGHNDQKFKDSTRYTNPHISYRHNLIYFIKQTREKGATPLLFSSIVRRNFNEFGNLIDTHGQYTLETRLVAHEMKVLFIDLQYLTEKLEIAHGVEGSRDLHLHFSPGENPYYPDGKEDDTHLSRKGALLIAEMVIKEIQTMGLSLAEYIKL